MLVHVLLGEENNKKVAIYEDRTVMLSSVDAPDVVDCLNYKTFWIQWKNGIIQIGWIPIYLYNKKFIKFHSVWKSS